MTKQYLDKSGTQKIVQGLKSLINTVNNKIPTDVVGKSQVLTKDNTNAYTPTDPNNPATKGYIDNIVGDINSVLDEINGEVI